ncbi:hypothetical protein ABKV19_006924 [Rosa sericea]
MNNKQYVGRADFLVFRAMNQHGFLGQLQEKKLSENDNLKREKEALEREQKHWRIN